MKSKGVTNNEYPTNQLGFNLCNGHYTYKLQYQGDVMHMSNYTRFLLVGLLLGLPWAARADITTDLVGHWQLDESLASDNAVDETGGTSLIASNSPGVVAGQVDGARSFNGSNQQFYATLSSVSGTVTNVTLSAWVYRASTSHRVMFGWYSTSHRRCCFEWYTDGYGYGVVENGSSNYPKFALTGTGWHHIVIAYDGNQGTAANRVRCYVDGSEVAMIQGGSGNPASYTISGAFRIGRAAAGFLGYTTGNIDDVRLYDRTLTADDVKELYVHGLQNVNFVSATMPGARIDHTGGTIPGVP
jgi:hypothetical protein